ncbi:MAG: NTP transferase domain-containing protein [Galactobacter sp.]
MRAAGIVVAGGRATRLGGADKASVQVDGVALVDHALTALEGASPLILVGPSHLARPGVLLTREEPPLGGPAAALAAGLRALATNGTQTDTAVGHSEDVVWLLACDLPRAAGLVQTVSAALATRPLADAEDGAIIRDAGGRDQWLAGIYRVVSLADALAAAGDVNGAPLRRIVAGLRLRRVDDLRGDAVDLDTWDDVKNYVKENRMHRTPPPELPEWIADVAPALGLDPATVPTALLLDLTRDVAHTVTRPGGPITTYLMGQAVAGGMSVEDAAAVVSTRVSAWAEAHPEGAE